MICLTCKKNIPIGASFYYAPSARTKFGFCCACEEKDGHYPSHIRMIYDGSQIDEYHNDANIRSVENGKEKEIL